MRSSGTSALAVWTPRASATAKSCCSTSMPRSGLAGRLTERWCACTETDLRTCAGELGRRPAVTPTPTTAPEGISLLRDLVCGETHPPNLSILISGGKETNRDSLSKGD